MKIIILGASGMLGHQLWKYLSEKYEHVYATIRKDRDAYHAQKLFEDKRVIEGIDAGVFSNLENVFNEIRPDVILNCIGITKRKENIKNPIPSITINALLPHLILQWAAKHEARVINFSTDCIFDGSKGAYRESSKATADDLYGRTKYLGEIGKPYGLTLRSSFIGLELQGKTELLEWFLSQQKSIQGFTRAIYTGLTTFELSRVIDMLILKYPSASGIYHVSSEPISKFELLTLIRNKLGIDITIVPDDTAICDRSLISQPFRHDFNYEPPSWNKMIAELCKSIKKERK